MRLKVDKESDALYFRLDEAAVVESEEVQPGVILDFDAEGHVVGGRTASPQHAGIPGTTARASI